MSRRVVLTGAGGLIGRTIAPLLPAGGTLYGATKAWAEALGSWLAATTATTVVALRIGYFALERPDADAVSAAERARG